MAPEEVKRRITVGALRHLDAMGEKEFRQFCKGYGIDDALEVKLDSLINAFVEDAFAFWMSRSQGPASP